MSAPLNPVRLSASPARASGNDTVTRAVVYADYAPEYLAAGFSPLPLPEGMKKSPPRGYTGRAGVAASGADVEEWRTSDPHGNIALRVPPGVIGIDFDAHKSDQACADCMALIDRFGPLPDTAVSTSRGDGVSGIRLYRVPGDYEAVGVLPGQAGETVQWWYRYVVAYPSTHPDSGAMYRWSTGEIPDVKDLPRLPQAWQDGLRAGQDKTGIATVEEPSWNERPSIEQLVLHGVPEGMAQDDTLKSMVWDLVLRKLGKEAEYALWQQAVSKTKLTDPAHPFTRADFDRERRGAVKKIANSTQKPIAFSPEGMALRVTERQRQEEHVSQSWDFWDPTEWFSGEMDDGPKLGQRADGLCMLYPSKTHSIASETEAGKTWLGLFWCAQEISAGRDACFVDFEDAGPGIYSRMVELAAREDIVRHFRYIAPDGPLPSPGALDKLASCSLVVLDGITEAMSMHGLHPYDNKDIVAFGAILPRAIVARGPAVVSLDHLPKDKLNQESAIGGIHKINEISGASFLLKNLEPFGRGRAGKSLLIIRKDRPGYLRQHGQTCGDGTRIAELAVDCRDDRPFAATLGLADGADVIEWRPTVLMQRAYNALLDGAKMGKGALAQVLGGNKGYAMQAINFLILDGYIESRGGGANTSLAILRPYTIPENDH